MSILIPLSVNATVDDVYHALWENVVSVFGVPETIISDVDKIFRSTKWKDLMSKLKVRHKLSTAHHQRTDGQAERKIQEAQAYLRIYVPEDENWEDWIPLLQYALNDVVGTATKETPFFIVFERNRKEDGYTPDYTVTVSRIHEQVTKDLEWNRKLMKKYFDSKCEGAPTLERGDRVYLKRTENSTNSTGKRYGQVKLPSIGTIRNQAQVGS